MEGERFGERLSSIESRIATVEARYGFGADRNARVETKLDGLSERLARLEERVSHLPTKEQAARLEERIARLPTTATILGTASLVLAVLIPFLTYLTRIQGILGVRPPG